MKPLLPLLVVLSTFAVAPAHALKSDRDQPAIIDADGVDIDFAAGLRVYYGNVKLRQGTLKLDADKLEVRFADDKLQSAVAVGEPAVFRQRPDGKDVDVVGEALFIHLDEVQNIVTLTRNAVLTQGSDSVAGRTIVYNMATDKMQVRSGTGGNTRTTKGAEGEAGAAPPPEPTAGDNPSAAESAQTGSGEQPSADGDKGQADSAQASGTSVDGDGRRPRIVLKPKAAE